MHQIEHEWMFFSFSMSFNSLEIHAIALKSSQWEHIFFLDVCECVFCPMDSNALNRFDPTFQSIANINPEMQH